MTAKEIFKIKHPQDGDLPLWAEMIAEEYAQSKSEEFAEWLQKKRYYTFENGKWRHTFQHPTAMDDDEYEAKYVKTTSELYQVFNQQP